MKKAIFTIAALAIFTVGNSFAQYPSSNKGHNAPQVKTYYADNTFEEYNINQLDNIVKLTTFIVGLSPDALPIVRGVRNRYVNTVRPPASTLLGVSALFHPDCVAEVEAVAVLPR